MLQARQKMFSPFWEVYNDTKDSPIPEVCKGAFTSERHALRAIAMSLDPAPKPQKVLSDTSLLKIAKATPGVSTQEALKALKRERAQVILSGNARE